MGLFSYICKGCGTAINGDCFFGGEKCVLIHVRKGQKLGYAEGHYDGYGGIIEHEGIPNESKFRGDDKAGINANSHNEICDSEFEYGLNSGIVAWHSKCYFAATSTERLDLLPSKNDPNQGGDRIRRKFK